MQCDTAPLPFPIAAKFWYDSKIPYWKPKTAECNQVFIHALQKFFGTTVLAEVHPGMLRAYQVERGKIAGPSTINHELNVMAQILRRAGLWSAMRDYYHPIREPAWKPPKVFSDTEEQRIFAFAERDPNLDLVRIVFTITKNTTASGSELRMLKLQHIHLDARPPRLEIPPEAAKNTARPRMIPLNEEAVAALREAVTRAAECGSYQPYHHLFPMRVKRNFYNPLKPASKSWLRKQTKALRERTQVHHLQPHGWRHQAVTRMLESGVLEHHVVKIAGWRSERMLARYGHARIEEQLSAVQTLCKKKPPKAVDGVSDSAYIRDCGSQEVQFAAGGERDSGTGGRKFGPRGGP